MTACKLSIVKSSSVTKAEFKKSKSKKAEKKTTVKIIDDDTSECSSDECTNEHAITPYLKTSSFLLPIPRFQPFKMCVDDDGKPSCFSANGVQGKFQKSKFGKKKYQMYVTIQKGAHPRLFESLSFIDSQARNMKSPLKYHDVIKYEDEFEFKIRIDLMESSFDRLRGMIDVIRTEDGKKLSTSFARNREQLKINLDKFNLKYYEIPKSKIRGFQITNVSVTVLN